MPSGSSPADLHIANALRLAQGDLSDTRTLRASGGRNAAYLTQQAVEKLLLALLVSEDIERSRAESHRLDVLIDKLPIVHPMRVRLSELAYLTIYATTFRYPKDGGRLPAEPDWHRIDGAIARAQGLIEEAIAHLGIDIGAGDRSPASCILPMR